MCVFLLPDASANDLKIRNKSLLKRNKDPKLCIQTNEKNAEENYDFHSLVEVKDDVDLQLDTYIAEVKTNLPDTPAFDFVALQDFIEEPQSPIPAIENTCTVSLTRINLDQQAHSSLGENEENENEFMCPACSKQFTNRSRLNSHMKWDCNRPRRYKCPYCEHRGSRSGDIYRHISRKHGSSKAYCLRLEEDQTKSAADAERWVVTRRRQRPQKIIRRQKGPFKCNRCSLEVLKKKSMLAHLRTCNQELKYRCPHCTHRAALSKYVFKHILAVHPSKEIYSIDHNGVAKHKG